MSNLLIVIKEPTLIDLISNVLVELNYHYDHLTTPDRLLQTLEQNDYKLVLMEMEQNDLSETFSYLKKIRSHEVHSQLPVVILTQSIEDDVVACFENGATEVISQAFQPLVLKVRLKKILEMLQRVQNLEQSNQQLKQHRSQYQSLIYFIDTLKITEDDRPLLIAAEDFIWGSMDATVKFWEILEGIPVPLGDIDRDLSRKKRDEVFEAFRSSNRLIFEGGHPKYVKEESLMMEIVEAGSFERWVDLIPLYIKSTYITLISERQRRKILRARKELELKNQEMQADVHLAAETQRAILGTVDEVDFVETSILYLPWGGVSGDMYRVFRRSDGTLNVFLGDATGHGIPAALVTMLVQMGVISLDPFLKTNEVIGQLNRLLASCIPEDKFMTAMFFRITPEGMLSMTNAGHPPLLILPVNGPVIQLNASGMCLGMFKNDVLPYEEDTYQLQRGDRVFACTDGIIEWSSREGQMFGIERLKVFLEKHRDFEIDHLLSKVLSLVQKITQEKNADDDVTLMGFEFQGSQ